ncbi:MAG: MlaE family lipid ABC transporter permease subunit [Nitrospirae bacterium]|nr:MlaE family lipid ABC transporter permease subunit [Nitrospirota bacterium]
MSLSASVQGERASLTIRQDEALHCTGPWTLQHLPDLERAVALLPWPRSSELLCDAGRITAMDTGGAVMLYRMVMQLRQQGRQVSVEGLRAEFAELLRMVSANWDRIEVAPATKTGRMEQFHRMISGQAKQAVRALGFVGESTVGVWRLLKRPSLIRWRALLRSLELDGFNALPITGLLAFLIGVVISYQGAEQLRKFGTNIFVVDLVGISLLREISPLIVAILIAGRSGSAYAAQIGTMKVTEELDAVQTLGLSPMQLLVLPRVFALMLILPLLTVYADGLGVFGGMLIASNQLHVSFTEFVMRFEEAVALRHFLIGIGKAPFFAIIIALVGCYQGFQIRGGVDDVGRHTTTSVVQSIFLVIVFDALCSILLSWWNL